jgi:ribosomal protein S9
VRPFTHANEHDLFVVERKKNSKKKARRSFQFSKR